mmetsp:Transcript_224/g.410  ORF Transcript_224/g.410 Transcript_224/m.410 type:complete len:80 (-) Transcript_224:42-281(-)
MRGGACIFWMVMVMVVVVVWSSVRDDRQGVSERGCMPYTPPPPGGLARGSFGGRDEKICRCVYACVCLWLCVFYYYYDV